MKDASRVLVLVDYSNWHYYLKEANRRIDWSRFAEYFQVRHSQVQIIYFEGMITKAHYLAKHGKSSINDFGDAIQRKKKIFEWIRSCGLTIVQKPVTSVYDRTSARYISKCNFDVEITIRAIDKLSEYDEPILCSGDGDFINLVKYIKGKYRRVTIISPPDRTNDNLRKSANRFVSLAKLKDHFISSGRGEQLDLMSQGN